MQSAIVLEFVDLNANRITASVAVNGMTRLAPWDDDGTVLAYAPNVEGLAHGFLVPFGRSISDAVGSLASNLRVDDAGNLVLKQ